jgi:hypothetical protein
LTNHNQQLCEGITESDKITNLLLNFFNVIWNLFCFSSCWDCSLWYNWGILVSLSEFSPKAFAYFRIRDNPYLGNLNVNVESFTSNILILDPCFSSCLVGRPTFGNVDQWPTNEQWSIEKKNPLLD